MSYSVDKVKQEVRKRFSRRYPEVLFACVNKLPENIEVSWEREDGLIVGTIRADEGHEFMTQGRNAKEFIEMVNDAVYDVPIEYYDLLEKYKAYVPPSDEMAKLADTSYR